MLETPTPEQTVVLREDNLRDSECQWKGYSLLLGMQVTQWRTIGLRGGGQYIQIVEIDVFWINSEVLLCCNINRNYWVSS